MDATQTPDFPDPFSHERAFGPTLWHAILATALFRCWHLLLFFGAWSTAICVISHTTKDLGIASTLLTVFVGILLRFDMSFDFLCHIAASVLSLVSSFRIELPRASRDTTRAGSTGHRSYMPQGLWLG